jgi:lysophospholipase L1-like esterase
MKSNKPNIKRMALPAVLIVLLIIAAGGLLLSMQRTRIDMAQTISFPSVSDLPPSQWQILSQKKVFFAHMSVGYNILDGAQRKQKEIPSFSFPAMEAKDPSELKTGGCYHGNLGHNGDPIAKINSFRDKILALKSPPPDLAFMKFCYVDIYAQTDVEALFSQYQQMIRDLQKELPGTRFLHCTAPLTSDPLSPKEKIKEMIRPLLGKMTEADSNRQRHRYNTLLRNAFPKETIFDIAQIESVTPQGHPCLSAGDTPMLFTGYTTDGGHLNQTGQDRLGEQFLIFLAANAK